MPADRRFSYGETTQASFYHGDPIDAPVLVLDQFTNAIWGSSLTLNAANTPSFAAFADLLTDGTQDLLGYDISHSATSGGGSYYFESSLFFGDPTATLGVDLIGHHIKTVKIAFAEDYSFDDGSDPAFGKFSVQFLGDTPPPPRVPEPASTFGLVAASSLVLMGINLRRRQTSSENQSV